MKFNDDKEFRKHKWERKKKKKEDEYSESSSVCCFKCGAEIGQAHFDYCTLIGLYDLE